MSKQISTWWDGEYLEGMSLDQAGCYQYDQEGMHLSPYLPQVPPPKPNYATNHRDSLEHIPLHDIPCQRVHVHGCCGRRDGHYRDKRQDLLKLPVVKGHAVVVGDRDCG